MLCVRTADTDLGLGVEVRVGELLAFSEGALDDLELVHVAQEVLYRCVWVVGICRSVDAIDLFLCQP